MTLLADALANPDTPLVELNRFTEVDLTLIIKAYEEAMRESETEEGVIVSGYGEVEKNKGVLALFDSITANYAQSPSKDSSSGSASVTLDTGIDSLGDTGIPFGDCFPCDGRITLGIDNLPHPAMFNIFSNLMDSIEAFIQQMKNLMDPTNFYSDICLLIDALRIVCPQDLLILLALLRFLLAHYITLSFQISLDWVSILGLILLPILMLIHTLLQMAINIGLGPLNCLINLLVFIIDLSASVEATVLSAKDAVETSVNSVKDTASQVSDLAGGDSDDSSETSDSSDAFNVGEDAIPTIPHPPDGGYQKYQEFIGKLSSVNSMLIAMTDIKITLEELLAKFTNALQAIIDLLSAGLILKMQFMAAITDIIRLIGFITALIKGLLNKSVCDDPSIPLSAQDIQAVIAIMNASSTAVSSSTSTSSSSETPSLISSTIGLDFDTATGELVLQNNITDESKRVPTCINAATSDDRDKIQEWIDQLNTASI